MYDEFDYWGKRTHPTSEDELYTDAHVEYIRKAIADAKNVLDFGPGIGRTFAAYKGIGHVEGYDISEIYRERAMKAAMELGINYTSVLNTSGNPIYLPYFDKQFDAAVACSVLMHQRPQYIVPVMKNLVRVAAKVAVMAWMSRLNYFTPHRNIEEEHYYMHIFNYDYFQICKENKWRVSDIEYFREQVFFTYTEGK